MDQVRKLLTTNLKSARKRLQISQAKLAERCGISTSYLAEIEAGKKFPSSTTLIALSEGVGLKPHELLLDDSSAPAFERHKVVTSMATRLKRQIADAIDRVAEDHLSP